VILAWHIAALDRHKKLPDLKALLAKTGRKTDVPLTMAQQKAQLMMLGDWLGRPVTHGKPKRTPRG
jgi:hypothetical protein